MFYRSFADYEKTSETNYPEPIGAIKNKKAPETIVSNSGLWCIVSALHTRFGGD